MGGGKATPQQALAQAMAAMHQKAQALTGVKVPEYYNMAAVNPLKYAEQIKKRKMLWSKSKDNKEVLHFSCNKLDALCFKTIKCGNHPSMHATSWSRLGYVTVRVVGGQAVE